MANNCCYACSPCQNQTITTIIEEQLPKVECMEHVDEFIKYCEKLINAIGTENSYLDRSESVATFINSIGNPTQDHSKRLNWHVCKKCLLSSVDIQTTKAVTEVLKLFKHMECATIMLSVVVYLLEREQQASFNKNQCIRLFRYITVLAKHMRMLNSNFDETEIEGILRFIVKATVVCALKMAPHGCCRFMCAPLDSFDLKDLETDLREANKNLQFDTIISIYNNTPTFLLPSQGEYPHTAVGIQNARDELILKLNMENSGPSLCRAVVIHGVSAIGKTTLASAVFNRLDLSRYRYCRVMMDHDCRQHDLKLKQEQILRHLFRKNLTMSDSTEGRETLLRSLRETSDPVFLFIDNVLRWSDLEMLLPDLSDSKMPRRILLTTRNADEGYKFQLPLGIEVVRYNVGTEPACREIVENYNERQQRVQQERRQRALGGEEDRIKQDEIERVMIGFFDCIYRQLRQPSQEAFLDIASFFCDWERNKVAYIVGEMELPEVEPLAELVPTSEGEEKVKMHDKVRARGKELSEGNRITDRKSLVGLLRNALQLQQTKGIWLREDDSDFSIEATDLDLMSRSLRVLSLGKHRRLNGRCGGAFETLRFLDISFEDLSSIQLTELRELRFLIVHLEGREAEFTINLPQPSELRYLEVDASYTPSFLHIIGEPSSLRGYHLSSSITLRGRGPALPIQGDNHPNGEIMPANVFQGREQIPIR